MRDIAEAIVADLGIPARSIAADDVEAHFGWLAMFVGIDNPTASQINRDTVGWLPRARLACSPTFATGVSLVSDGAVAVVSGLPSRHPLDFEPLPALQAMRLFAVAADALPQIRPPVATLQMRAARGMAHDW